MSKVFSDRICGNFSVTRVSACVMFGISKSWEVVWPDDKVRTIPVVMFAKSRASSFVGSAKSAKTELSAAKPFMLWSALQRNTSPILSIHSTPIGLTEFAESI